MTETGDGKGREVERRREERKESRKPETYRLGAKRPTGDGEGGIISKCSVFRVEGKVHLRPK